MKKAITIIGIFGLILVQAQVGINTDTPQATLDIKSEGSSSATKALKINNSANTEIVTVTDEGSVGIGTATPQDKLEVNQGSIRVTSPQAEIRLMGVGGTGAISSSIRTSSSLSKKGWLISQGGGSAGLHPDTFMIYSHYETGSVPSHGYDDRLAIIHNTGNVGIGTITPTERLHVIGNIKASGTITPDYVFQKYYDGHSSLKADYQMMSLSEVEAFTREYKHLPGVPSASEVKKSGGILVNRATEINLEKIEELYLHTIEQDKKIKTQQKRIEKLESLVQQLLKK